MARIKDAKGRDTSTGESGYERLFGNHELGLLISKCQAAVISSGNELENIIADKINKKYPYTKDIAVGSFNKEKRTFRDAKTDSSGKKHHVLIDVVIERGDKIKLIELKDGDVFDVKKVAGEIESLKIANKIITNSRKIPEERVTIHFCCFNAKNNQQIEHGAKGLLPKGSAMTGRELCEELGIDFDEIIEERKRGQPENLEYFLTELVKIPQIKKIIEEKIKEKHNITNYV